MRLAFQGNFTDHHATPARLHLDRIDLRNEHVAPLDSLIDTLVVGSDLANARALLATIPGISTTGAENILAETGADMSAFPTPAQLAS